MSRQHKSVLDYIRRNHCVRQDEVSPRLRQTLGNFEVDCIIWELIQWKRVVSTEWIGRDGERFTTVRIAD